VAVLAVDKGSTAANAGVKAGDVILGINGQDVSSVEQLEDTLSQLAPGTKVTIKYRSGTSTVHEGNAKLDSLGS
jgi:S1-C subfamily serine protease